MRRSWSFGRAQARRNHSVWDSSMFSGGFDAETSGSLLPGPGSSVQAAVTRGSKTRQPSTARVEPVTKWFAASSRERRFQVGVLLGEPCLLLFAELGLRFLPEPHLPRYRLPVRGRLEPAQQGREAE